MKKTKKYTNLPKKFSKSVSICQNALFLDIETTGFSPFKNQLYLIGTACFEPDTSGKIAIEQFFAENLEEEPLLLLSLQKLLSRFDTVITFHGTRFDLPFLTDCGKRLGIDIDFSTKKNTDLYLFSRSFRHIFCLENYKQKTLEKFLGIGRKDLYSGGELIRQYKKYTQCPDDERLHILLQHNYEDVLGMAELLSLYAFDVFFQGGFIPSACKILPCRNLDGSAAKEMILSCQLSEPLPAPVSCSNSCYYLHAADDMAYFRVGITEGSLKYFYADYKDYYYLPDEDTAIHKSVAAFVDKAHRQKAKASDCYSRKEGLFLPQYKEVIPPAFYKEYKDSVSYFEWNDAFAENKALLKQFCLHMLETLKSGI